MISDRDLDGLIERLTSQLAKAASKVEQETAELKKLMDSGQIPMDKETYPFNLGKVNGIRFAANLVASKDWSK